MDELTLKNILAMAEVQKESNPHLAVILFAIAGSAYAGSIPALTDHIMIFAKSEQERLSEQPFINVTKNLQ